MRVTPVCVLALVSKLRKFVDDSYTETNRLRSGCQFSKKILSCALICISVPSAMLAQFTQVTASTTVPWPAPGHDYVKALQETVTPADGQTSIRIDFPVPPGRQFTMPFKLAYDSNGIYFLEYLPSGSSPSNITNSFSGNIQWVQGGNPVGSGGWSYTLPWSNGPVQQTVTTGQGYNPQSCTSYIDWTFFDTNGGRHLLKGLTTNNGNSSCAGQVTAGGDYYYGGYVPSGSGSPSQGLKVGGMGGEVYDFTNTNSGLPTKVEDRNGNYLTLQQASIYAPVTVTDTLGRTALTLSGLNTSANTVALAGGLTYNVTWTSVSYNFNPNGVAIGDTDPECAGALGMATGTYMAIQSILLPNGTSYSFTYDNGATGLVSSITYPTGAKVSYTWSRNSQGAAAHFLNPNGSPNFCTIYYDKPAIQARTVAFNGSSASLVQNFAYSTQWGTTYNWQWAGKTTTITTTDIIQNKTSTTTYTYTPGVDESDTASAFNPVLAQDTQIPLENTIATVDGSGMLQTVTKTWADAQKLTSQQTAIGGQVKFTAHSYNPLSNDELTETDDYDFGSGGHGALLRKAVRNYLPTVGSGPSEVPCQDIVSDGSGNRLSETDYYYDSSGSSSPCQAPAALSVSSAAAVQHDEVQFGTSSTFFRGNLARKVQWASTGTSPVTTYSYDETGQIISSTDPCGNTSCSDMTGNAHTTTYSYADNYTGGTVSPSGSTNAFLTQKWSPATNGVAHVQSYSYRFSDGQLSTATDENGQLTNYTYNDPLNRLTEVQGAPDPDNGNQRPTTLYAYSDTAPSPSVTTSQLLNTAGTTQSTVSYMDGMGQVVRTQTSDPEGVDYVDTVFNGTGSVYSVSNPHRASSAPTDGTTTTIYDALGRPILLTHPDGSTLHWQYSGNSTTYTDEAGLQWIRTSDALGRLTNIKEPTGLLTGYVYDGLNNLNALVQAGVSGEKPRVRGFAYDSLSRLMLSSNPETGTVGYIYDVNGNVTSKTDARGVATSYSYDALNRLTNKSSSGGSGIPGFTYSYFYDQTNEINFNNSQNPIGRLVWATNGVDADIHYSYDPMGRVIHQEGCTPSACAAGSNPVSAQYDLAGNLTYLTYPDGHHIQQTWDSAGHLSSSALVDIGGVSTSVSYLQSASYDPSGALNLLTLGNGLQQTVGRNNRLQPQTMSVSTPLAPLSAYPFLSHTYCYMNCTTGGTANNGDLWGITDNLNAASTQGFTYDGLNRISGFYLGGSLNQQYQIDSFGNMTGVVAGKAVSAFDSTNRVNNLPCATSVPAYDPAGNQLCDTDPNGMIRQYNFDAENKVSQIASLGYTASPFATYVYGPDSTRVQKADAAGNYTETVNFNGQPIAEKDQTGAWTDYVYAGSQKIANVRSQESILHVHLDRIANSCNVTFVVGGVNLQNLPFLPGDQFAMSVKASPGVQWGAGFFQTDNQGMQLPDQNGQDMAILSLDDGLWHHEVGNLGAYYPSGIARFQLAIQPATQAGPADAYVKDIVIMHSNGTITPILTANQVSLTVLGGAAVSNVPQTVCAGSNLTMDYNPYPIEPTEGTTFFMQDHLGSSQIESAYGGWPTAASQFAPYGGEINPEPTDNNYKFTGKERDQESGLDYFGARYYGSTTGRFMSPDYNDDPDPVPYADFTNPQSLNLYSYVNNNPLVNVDPDGHDCVVQSRTSAMSEGVSFSSGNCNDVIAGDGQSKTYVPGTVTGITVNGGNSIDIGYNSYDGQSSGVTNAGAAPIPDNPGLAYNYGNNAQGYQMLAGAANVVNKATAIAVGAYGGAILGPMAYEALAAGAEGEGVGLTEHGAQRLAQRGISPEQAKAAIQAAKQAGNVVSKIGKYGTPQSIYTANGIRVVVEEAGANAGKIITAFFK